MSIKKLNKYNKPFALKLMPVYLFVLLSIIVIIAACDGPFPSQTKPNVPKDHSDNIRGAFHKPGKDYPYGYDAITGEENCSGRRCHHQDLLGGQSRIDLEWKVAPSCFQCHGKLWKEIDTSLFLEF